MSDNNSESRLGILLVVIALSIAFSLVIGLFVLADKF